MRKILIFIIILFVIFAISKGLLTYSGKIHRDFTQCFSVDSQDNLYIAHRDIIEVYKGETLIRSIDPHTNRDYYIYIENDELIIGHSSGKVIVYDLMGNYIRDENVVAQTLSKEVFKRGAKIFNGKTYCINKNFGCNPYEIMCNDKTIYKQPYLDYVYNGMIFKMSFILCFISALILVPWIILDKNNGFNKLFNTR